MPVHRAYRFRIYPTREQASLMNRTSHQAPDPASAAGCCGVYCGGCPAYMTRCLGCRSEERGPRQKRTSKWSCKIRTCAKEQRLQHCGECDTFPCKLRRRLDAGYVEKYTIDLVANCHDLQVLGAERWIEEQRERFTCSQCGQSFSPYDLRCAACDPGTPAEHDLG